MEKNIKIRMARAQDAEALARIYAYYVEKTAITFEHEAPDAAEMETRRKKIFEHYPYLVAEQEDRVLGYVYAHEFYGRPTLGRSKRASTSRVTLGDRGLAASFMQLWRTRCAGWGCSISMPALPCRAQPMTRT